MGGGGQDGKWSHFPLFFFGTLPLISLLNIFEYSQCPCYCVSETPPDWGIGIGIGTGVGVGVCVCAGVGVGVGVSVGIGIKSTPTTALHKHLKKTMALF